MRHGPALGNRVMAAKLLAARGDNEALPAMVKEWAAPIGLAPRPQQDRDADSPLHLFALLINSPSPEALDAIAARWTELPLQWKQRALWDVPNALLTARTARRTSRGYEGAAERLMVSGLADKDSPENAPIPGTQEPPLGESAAVQLARCWPKKYRFNRYAADGERQRMLKTLRAQVAKKH
jgi:hypothetical protein